LPVLDRLLIAYDGSEPAVAGLRFATRLASGAESRLTLACVIVPGGERAEPEAPGSLEEAEPWLAGVAERAAAESGLGVEPRVVEAARVPDALLDLAEETGCELLVAGRSGRGGLRRWLLGSVAERLIEYAPCSVAIFPERPDPRAIATVLVGDDGSEPAREAVETAATAAARLSVPLRVVHAVSFTLPFATEPYEGVKERLRAHGEEILAASCEGLAAPLESVSTELREGDPRRELLAAAAESERPLLVVGHRGAGGFVGLRLGSTARDVGRGAPCPVLVAKEAG
jgi:nucleotide-binding universal stress UspA family protein